MSQHIADLVRLQQSNKDKLSSQQDFRILDEMLARALQPLAIETIVYREWLAEIIAYSVESRRRQNDTLRNECIIGICDEKESYRLIIDAGIDRSLIFSFLDRVAKLGRILEQAQISYLKRRSTRVDNASLQIIANTKLILGDGPRVTAAIRTSNYWYRAALKAKESIISHYYRLLYGTASKISYASGGRVELDSSFGDAYLAADTAVNKFRPDRGVFANYLTSYLRGSSRISASHAMGLAAPGARVLSADALQTDPIDDIDFTDPTASAHTTDNSLLKNIALIANDPDVRAALIVGEVVSPRITELGKEYMQNKEHKI